MLWLLLAVPEEGMLRIVSETLHPVAQLRRSYAQVLSRLNIRDAAILDRAHTLSLNSRANFRLSVTHLQFRQNT